MIRFRGLDQPSCARACDEPRTCVRRIDNHTFDCCSACEPRVENSLACKTGCFMLPGFGTAAAPHKYALERPVMP